MEKNKMLIEEKLDTAALLAKAEEIGRIAEEEAGEADRNACFSDRVARAIKEAGFHKLMRPKQYGGLQVDLRTYGEIVRTVARYSVAAGWLTYFYSMHEVWAAYLPPKGREEIFGQGGLLADVVAPVGRVEKDGDGYRLYGQWNFCSGVLHSDWIGLGAMMELPDGDSPEYCLLVLPKSDVQIVENWDTMGLRASGSNGVLVEGAYVPLHRIFPAGRVMAHGKPVGGDYDENDPVYRMPFMPLFLLGFPLVSLGGAERLVSLFQERTEKRIRVFKGGAKEKDSAASQRLLAEMKTELNAMEGIVEQYIRQLEACQKEGKTVMNDMEREQLFAWRGYVAKASANIAVRTLLTLGGNSIFKGDPVELFTRDLLAVAAHPNSLWEDAMAAYGRTIFGLPGDPVW
ncbi:flavin-dependent monooxygenase [Parageobacillus thermoglucosidasius]|uniref:Flavin-dependent monooxygenase n=1 Tax=Parageobacillus thermoglucosidasius TaxID=1426 RepID=A0AB38R429_PARTM|nr:flavin-dependent monooxygenase [Parageobacillus thermoglucosidasius]UOE78348.1 flavin-dependent monooxygenase [Parageobacillus thermoglucosidasius]GMO01257.1 acyl-CoA dehydrogenase family protein [Parageobacillus thermoglucosidasius]